MPVLSESPTNTLPVDGFTATPTGWLNCPSRVTRRSPFCNESTAAAKNRLDNIVVKRPSSRMYKKEQNLSLSR